AGLHCFAMPVDLGTGRQLAVIGGRAFLTSADYRALAERFRIGDLQELLSSEIFKNVIFASRQDLDDLARRIDEAARELNADVASGQRVKQAVVAIQAEESLEAQKSPTNLKTESASVKAAVESQADTEDSISRRAQIQNRYFPAETEFKQACSSVLDVLVQKHKFTSLALLLREQGVFAFACGTGSFKDAPI